MKRFIKLVVTTLVLFLLLILPKYIYIGTISLLDLQRDLIHWNYIGTAAYYIVFIVLYKFSKKTLGYFGVHLGNWKDKMVWFIIATVLILSLFRVIDLIIYGSITLKVPTLSTFVFQFIFIALGEELFWRGYVQTEYGIVIASVLFGFIHFLNIIVVDISLFDAIIWDLTATMLGFIFGLVRKNTDSVYASALLHGLYNIFNHIFV